MATQILSWDCREQPDINKLARAVNDLSGGKVHIYEINTQSDQYAIVASDRPLTGNQVAEEWDKRWEGQG